MIKYTERETHTHRNSLSYQGTLQPVCLYSGLCLLMSGPVINIYQSLSKTFPKEWRVMSNPLYSFPSRSTAPSVIIMAGGQRERAQIKSKLSSAVITYCKTDNPEWRINLAAGIIAWFISKGRKQGGCKLGRPGGILPPHQCDFIPASGSGKCWVVRPLETPIPAPNEVD